jgi:hypothetical protein
MMIKSKRKFKIGFQKIFLECLTHSDVWGSNPQDFTEQAQSRKVDQLEKIKIVNI